jgi:hypothetical protein
MEKIKAKIRIFKTGDARGARKMSLARNGEKIKIIVDNITPAKGQF